MKATLKDRLKKIRQTHDYRLEKAKLEFVQGITRVMRQENISNAELARRLETSPAYITKVMRGDTNFTLDSLVKITHAMNSRIHIHVANSAADVRWFEAFDCSRLADNEPHQKMMKPIAWKKAARPAKLLKEKADEACSVYA